MSFIIKFFLHILKIYHYDYYFLQVSSWHPKEVRESGGTEDTSSSVVLEDTTKFYQEKQFTNTECKIGKDKTPLHWGDIYQAIK